MDDEKEQSRSNKNKIVIDDVTQTVPHTICEDQFDFKNPQEIDEPLYALAMESTQVVADLLNWPDYDNTEIGIVLSLLLQDDTPFCILVLLCTAPSPLRMLYYVMLCYAMSCYVMLYYIMLCYVMLCHVMLCYVTLCYVMSCYVKFRFYSISDICHCWWRLGLHVMTEGTHTH